MDTFILETGQSGQPLLDNFSPIDQHSVTSTAVPTDTPTVAGDIPPPPQSADDGDDLVYEVETPADGGWWWLHNDSTWVCRATNPTAYAVYCYLVMRGDGCYPGQDTIADELGISERSVRNAIKALSECGAIQRERETHQSNVYRLTRCRAEAKFAGAFQEQRQNLPEAEAKFAGEQRQNLPPNNTHRTRLKNKRERTADAGSLQTESPKKKPAKRARPKRERFVPPTVEEVAAYCRERKNGIDPEAFVASNEAKGWLVGRNRTPMVNWRAAVITWEKTHANQSGQPGGNRNGDRQGGTPPQSHYKKLTRI